MLIVLYDQHSNHWLKFDNPVRVISTNRTDDIITCLETIDEAVNREKLFAAGFISYEAAPAFDKAFVTHTAGDLPLLCFGIFETAEIITPDKFAHEYPTLDEWLPAISPEEYYRAVDLVKNHIVAGDTYQVNLTTRLHSSLATDPQSIFFNLVNSQPAGYAAFVDLESHSICSFSPELFFQHANGILRSKPMKGTAPRGRTLTEDIASRTQLQNSDKNKAENIMIVDMIRNDMGRIAKPGSVKVERLFEIEKYPYVWQMTSTVQSRVDWSLVSILKSLYPCASITGAPKVKTMEIIKKLEDSPRGIYTGSIGYIAPGPRAQFNVAIRTFTVNKSSKTAEYGVGSGIVWDSNKEDEYKECLSKAGVLYQRTEPFKLIESILWQPKHGYYLLEKHLNRLSASADYFDFPVDICQITKSLQAAMQNMQASQKKESVKIRLILDRYGQMVIERQPIKEISVEHLRVCLAHEPVDSANIFLFHKTTNRSVYDKASEHNPEFDDVILWNENKEVTESCRSNIVIQIDGKWLTPATDCGLLPGVFREILLETGQITEGIIPIEHLSKAQQIYCINSVRRWMRVESVTSATDSQQRLLYRYKCK